MQKILSDNSEGVKDELFEERTKGQWHKAIMPHRNFLGKPQTTVFVNPVGDVQNVVANVYGKTIPEAQANAALICEAVNNYQSLKKENERLKDINRELVEALKPFAEMFGEFPESKVQQGGPVFHFNNKGVTVFDFLTASRLIEKAKSHNS